MYGTWLQFYFDFGHRILLWICPTLHVPIPSFPRMSQMLSSSCSQAPCCAGVHSTTLPIGEGQFFLALGPFSVIFGLVFPGILVSYWCCKEFPQIWGLKTTQKYSLIILEARGPDSVSLDSRWNLNNHPFTLSDRRKGPAFSVKQNLSIIVLQSSLILYRLKNPLS